MVEESENTIQLSNAIELQQAFFDNQNDCDYVRYEKETRQYLIQNIAFALYGSPSEEGDLLGDSDSVKLRGYTVRQTERVTDVYNKICEQIKYSVNGEDVVMTVILVVCVAPKSKGFFKDLLPTNPGDWVDLHRSRDVSLWCTAVFKIRKCIPLGGNEKPCKSFIDGDARVYSDWESYLEQNQQPKCLLVVPTDGTYTCEDETTNKDDYRVKLSVVPSPALGLKAAALKTGDATSTVVGLGSVGVLGAAMLTPLAPVAITAAVVGSIGSAAYTTFRSGLHIHDRRVHEQSISLANSEARMSWITIGASVVSVSAGVAAQVLARSAAAGANMAGSMGRFLLTSVDLLSGMNLITGAAGVLNGLVFIIEKFGKYGETPSGLELFQFTMSTLFFLNAAMSKRTAMSIVEESQASTINTFRDTLRSNRHRKMFDKVSAETRRVNGHMTGNSEVIRAIKIINNKDQFFADILKVNKDLNANKMRMSLTRDGQVNLNQQHKFDPSQLYGMGKEVRSELFSAIGPSTNTTPNVPVRLQPGQISTFSVQEEWESEPMVNIRPGDVIRIGEFLIRFSSSSAQDIADIMNNVTTDIRGALETISYNVIAQLIPSDVRQLKLLNPDNDLLTEVIRFVFNWMKLNSTIDNASGGSNNAILALVKQFFVEGHVKPGSIMLLKEELMAWLRDEVNEGRSSTICPVCNCATFAKVV